MREYDFSSPLSANFLPVSESFTIFATKEDSATPVLPSSIYQNSAYSISLLPSHPVGVVLFKQYLEVNYINLTADKYKRI